VINIYKIVPDTNFLIYVFKHKINFDYEIERALNAKFEIIILSPVKEELEKLLKSGDLKGKEKLAVNLALAKIKNYKLIDYNANYADEAILNYAKENKNVIVATNDKELKEKLIENNIPVMVVRQKKYFEVFGMI
jgi:rRNA-processing protein FCF1